MRLLHLDIIKKFLSTGQGFIPINAKNKGDSVQIYFKDGSTELLDMQSESFLAHLLHYFGTSISANRNRYGKIVGKKQLVPIVLSYGMTLIPYNVREAIGNQSKIGWFIAKEISRFHRKSQHKTTVQLLNHDVNVMHSEKFCNEQFKNAKYIELCYVEIHEPYRKNWLFPAG